MASGAFECAAAALMLKNQVRYASPVFDYSGPLKIDEKTVPAPLHAIQCISNDCKGVLSFIKIVA